MPTKFATGQYAEELRREQFDVGQVEDELLLVLGIDERIELFGQRFDLGRLQDGRLHQSDHGDAGVILNDDAVSGHISCSIVRHS